MSDATRRTVLEEADRLARTEVLRRVARHEDLVAAVRALLPHAEAHARYLSERPRLELEYVEARETVSAAKALLSTTEVAQ